VVICLLVSGAGVYYAYFGCFFLLTAGLACAFRERRWVPLVSSGALVAVIGLGVVGNLLPCLLYQHEVGPNPDVANRLKWESEVYALKLTHLVLPVQDHRLPLAREWRESYSQGGPWPLQEGCFTSSLGTVGTVGLVLVVVGFLFGRKNPGDPRPVPGLGLLTVCGFLLGTVGGVGALFANYINPSIRGYNRLSIYLGFFALAGVAVLLTRLVDRAGRLGTPGRLAAWGFCLLVLAGGIWDQSTPGMVPDYAATRAAYDSQVSFAAQVEQSLPQGAMVFQLPFVGFPELPPTARGFSSYDHFRPALASHRLRWSHGTVMGRYGNAVLAPLGCLPADALVERVVALGYSGIHLDRRGYADDGQEMVGRLRALLGVEPLISPDGRDVFFTLLPYTERVRGRYTEEEWEERQEWYRSPVVALWGAGADRSEGEGTRWYRSPATLNLVNPSREPRRVTLRFTPTVPPQEGRPHVTVSGEILPGAASVEPNGAPCSVVVAVPPGTHPLRFECDGKAIRDGNGRKLVFNLAHFEVLSDETPPDRSGPRQQFADTSDVRLALRPPGTGAGIEGNAQVRLTPGSDGLVVHAGGDDPNLFLPAFAHDPGTALLVRVELTSPAETTLELFYETNQARGYDESRKVSHPLHRGRNEVLLKLAEPSLAGRLRLDPGAVAGEYVLHAVEVRAVPRDSQD
jgi:phosphoglycerol transferase